MDNLRFLINTHENNVSLAELSLKYFFKHNKRDDLKITLVSNKFNTDDLKYKDRVTYYSSDINLHCQGYHFKDSMISVLSKIEEEYVFFLLDDYFFINEIKYNDLSDALNLMKCENIDYFGFDDIGGILKLSDFEKLNTQCESNIKDELYIRHKDYQYLFSVQPCIWKKTSLLELLKKHENISLHDLDETKPYIKENGLEPMEILESVNADRDYTLAIFFRDWDFDNNYISYNEIDHAFQYGHKNDDAEGEDVFYEEGRWTFDGNLFRQEVTMQIGREEFGNLFGEADNN